MAMGTRTAIAPAADQDRTLEQALDRIAELSSRLWNAQSAHLPRSYRLGRARRCTGCGQAYPCATVRALDPRLLRRG